MSVELVADTASDGAAPCACGSGLRADRCCAFDWSTPPNPPRPTPEVEEARTALQAGDLARGEALLVPLLNQNPRHLGALGLLHDLRRAQGNRAAAEALLARIVAIEPNDIVATQTLALMLFERGAMAEAEVHARNAVRLAPTDPRSHNLMGMIMTEAQRPQDGEHHYRRVLELGGRGDAIVLANLAWNLKNQGRMA